MNMPKKNHKEKKSICKKQIKNKYFSKRKGESISVEIYEQKIILSHVHVLLFLVCMFCIFIPD